MNECPKILIADDEQECIDFVYAALEGNSYEIISAHDGEEAFNLAQQEKPHLIILDVQMPKQDGFQVFTQLRSDEGLADIPVIMLTGIGERTGIKTSSSDMAGYLGSEPEAYIDKPIEPAILRQTVNRLLKK